MRHGVVVELEVYRRRHAQCYPPARISDLAEPIIAGEPGTTYDIGRKPAPTLELVAAAADAKLRDYMLTQEQIRFLDESYSANCILMALIRARDTAHSYSLGALERKVRNEVYREFVDDEPNLARSAAKDVVIFNRFYGILLQLYSASLIDIYIPKDVSHRWRSNKGIRIVLHSGFIARTHTRDYLEGYLRRKIAAYETRERSG